MKPIQIRYQVYYRLRDKYAKFTPPKTAPQTSFIALQPCIPSYNSYLGNGKFEFLNLAHTFDQIDWNFKQNGKLWTYNLNYFEFLNQPQLTKDEGLQLISDFISKKQSHQDAYEPYPISLRLINWVKFLGQHQIQNSEIDAQLYSDSTRLTQKLEYHILANHFLENGFGLLFAAYHFQNEKLYQIAHRIIQTELKEQILSDGAHYELSPMYHQIILTRVLDSYNLLVSNPWKSDTLKETLFQTAQNMLSWLEHVTFRSGDIPMVNDAAKGIAPSSKNLIAYARQLGISKKDIPLGQSGYRMYQNEQFELFCDVGQIAPSYQPGHSHADSLQFLLSFNNQPIIVDTGISTYEKNGQRHLERSTSAHNTVVVNGENSSQVWSGFRVGKRAKTTMGSEAENHITASHDGYKHLGVIHERTFMLERNEVMIKDLVHGIHNPPPFSPSKGGKKVTSYLHFHPDLEIKQQENNLVINNKLQLTIEKARCVILEDYLYAEGYNMQKQAKKAVIELSDSVTMTFTIYKHNI